MNILPHLQCYFGGVEVVPTGIACVDFVVSFYDYLGDGGDVGLDARTDDSAGVCSVFASVMFVNFFCSCHLKMEERSREIHFHIFPVRRCKYSDQSSHLWNLPTFFSQRYENVHKSSWKLNVIFPE